MEGTHASLQPASQRDSEVVASHPRVRVEFFSRHALGQSPPARLQRRPRWRGCNKSKRAIAISSCAPKSLPAKDGAAKPWRCFAAYVLKQEPGLLLRSRPAARAWAGGRGHRPLSSLPHRRSGSASGVS